jgi:hypothetical protein
MAVGHAAAQYVCKGRWEFNRNLDRNEQLKIGNYKAVDGVTTIALS